MAAPPHPTPLWAADASCHLRLRRTRGWFSALAPAVTNWNPRQSATNVQHGRSAATATVMTFRACTTLQTRHASWEAQWVATNMSAVGCAASSGAASRSHTDSTPDSTCASPAVATPQAHSTPSAGSCLSCMRQQQGLPDATQHRIALPDGPVTSCI
jgi:hypothetical protein